MAEDLDGRTQPTSPPAAGKPRLREGRNSHESYQGSMTSHWESRAASTPVGSIGPGIGCRKRVSACFHLLRQGCRPTSAPAGSVSGQWSAAENVETINPTMDFCHRRAM